MSTTQFADFSNSPQLDIVESKQERKARGVKAAYVDTYNQAEMAKYNNEYNYWLWQQQAEYNDPINQVARLKAAGLNPNYNAIEGTGNLTTRPESSGKITANPVSNVSSMLNMGISGFNAILKGLSEGVQSYSNLANTPSLGDIKGYRESLTDYMAAKSGQGIQKAQQSIFDTLFKQLKYGYNTKTGKFTGGPELEFLNKRNESISKDIQQKTNEISLFDDRAKMLQLKNDILELDKFMAGIKAKHFEEMTESEIKSIQAQTSNTLLGTILRSDEHDWKTFSKTAGPILQFLKIISNL